MSFTFWAVLICAALALWGIRMHRTRSGSKGKVIAIIATLLAFVALVWMPLFGNHRPTKLADHTAPSTTASSSAASTPSSTPAPEKCDGSSTVKLDPNAGGNLFSQGISPETEQARKQIQVGAEQDPRVLQVYYNASPLGKMSPIQKVEDIAPVKNGACYTATGMKALHDWEVLWKVAKLSKAPLPATGVNTGATPGGGTFQVPTGAIPSSPGVLVVFVGPDGKVIGTHFIRTKCGNVITEQPIPSIPKKPQPTPSPVCPPGQFPNENGVCLLPKNPSEDPANQDNVPTQVQGSNPPVTGSASAPAVPLPTKTYTPPPPPPAPTPTTSTSSAPAPKPTGTATSYAPACPDPNNPACG